MIEIKITDDWIEEFPNIEEALIYVNALLELIRRQEGDALPEQINSLEEFKKNEKNIFGENSNISYCEYEFLFNILIFENILFEVDKDAIYLKGVRISKEPSNLKKDENIKFQIELVYQDGWINKEEIKRILGIDLKKYGMIKL